MNKDINVQFVCKDCERYNLCKYYHNRKEDSYICKNFHLPNILDKIRAEIERKAHSGQWSDATMYGMLKAVAIIDKYKEESEVDS